MSSQVTKHTMAENNNDLGFWQLAYEFFKKDVMKPEDNLIILVHWLLLKNKFKVLGPGSENTIAENEQSSDMLPENWSQNVVSYYMRYTRDDILYLLNGVKSDDNSIIFNFYNVTTKHVSSAAIDNIDVVVQYINDVLNNKDIFLETINSIQEDLINPLQEEEKDDKKNASTQTTLKGHEITNSPVIDCNQFYYDFCYTERERRENLLRINPLAQVDQILPPNPDPTVLSGDGQPNPDRMRQPDVDDNM